MDGKHFFFQHEAQANLTGEQLRVMASHISQQEQDDG